MTQHKRVLTGLRPTGKLHLGHYVGMIKNLVELQADYEVFLFVADYHALTRKTEAAYTRTIRANGDDVILDLLAAGVDPERVTIYRQSDVPSVAELSLLFGMLTTVPFLERVPSLKDILASEHIEQPSYGLLGYPVLQAADILHVKADLVPVGKDQESHLELAREVARRFNRLYGNVFPETKPLISDLGTLPGLDGKAKMSKSLGNDIKLDDDSETIGRKIKKMYTDPSRIHPTDPGKVEGNPVFLYHDAFNDNVDEVADLKDRYARGTVGDVEVKDKLVAALERFLEPMRARRAEFTNRPGYIDELFAAGATTVRPISEATVVEAKRAIGLI